MNKTISLALLVGGIILLIYGVAAADSLGSAFSRLFTGAPTDRTIWLLVAGTIATLTGAAGLRGGSKPV
jgi:amino acid permease